MNSDHEFDPITPEQLAAEQADRELARKIRDEVVRINRGDADEEIEQEQQEAEQEKEKQEKERRRRERFENSTFWQLWSGSILVNNRITTYYRYLICFAAIFLLRIVVVFWTLHLDSRYGTLEREVRRLRERSVRLHQQRTLVTTHSSITNELRRRGIDLREPTEPPIVVDVD